jgi:hypothetical protein
MHIMAEQNRMHVLVEIDRHRRIEFSPAPASYVDPQAVVVKKAVMGKKTAKLDHEAVRAIRQALEAGEETVVIAARHHVSKNAIVRIRNRTSWSEVE